MRSEFSCLRDAAPDFLSGLVRELQRGNGRELAQRDFGSITTPCTMSSIHAFDILPNGEDYVIQSDDIVCAGNLNEIEPQVLGHYAQIAAGQGFTSELVLTNPSASRTATGIVVFRGDAGLPFPLNFGGVPL